VTVVTLASLKGSPGVTTAATALGASWPVGRRVLLVEADPYGGDLAPRYGSTSALGLASLFAAARRSLDPDAVWEHVDHLPGGLPVLFGLSGVAGAMANEKAWPTVAAALGALDADLVVDAGRLLPHFAGGVADVLAQSDVLVVLCRPTLEGIVHLRAALPGLVAELRGCQLLVVPTGSGGYAGTEIGSTLGVAVGPLMPDDRRAADALANKGALKRLERTALLKWAATLIGALGIEAVATQASGSEEPIPVDVDETDPQVAPVDVKTLASSSDEALSSEQDHDAVTVGAGTDGEAQP
jgi:hypothetical protein